MFRVKGLQCRGSSLSGYQSLSLKPLTLPQRAFFGVGAWCVRVSGILVSGVRGADDKSEKEILSKCYHPKHKICGGVGFRVLGLRKLSRAIGASGLVVLGFRVWGLGFTEKHRNRFLCMFPANFL